MSKDIPLFSIPQQKKQISKRKESCCSLSFSKPQNIIIIILNKKKTIDNKEYISFDIYKNGEYLERLFLLNEEMLHDKTIIENINKSFWIVKIFNQNLSISEMDAFQDRIVNKTRYKDLVSNKLFLPKKLLSLFIQEYFSIYDLEKIDVNLYLQSEYLNFLDIENIYNQIINDYNIDDKNQDGLIFFFLQLFSINNPFFSKKDFLWRNSI